MITHKHHLKPKHLGGTDDPSNLLEVTPEEHSLIHEARWYAYHQWQDKLAWQGLSHQIGREEVFKTLQREGGRMGGLALKGKPRTQEYKDKLSAIRKGCKGTFKGKKHTEETKEKMRQKAKGRTPWNKGKTWVSVGVWK